MIKVTYLDHSGFAVKTPSSIIVFDYYRDPSHSLTKILRENPDLPVIFLVTHSHPDHYNTAIFDLAQEHKRVFVLSDDIPARHLRDDIPVAWINPGGHQADMIGGVDVKAFGSTDKGVSYLVTTKEGVTIFHAGDLNYWHWQDESTEKEVKQAYDDFVKEMRRIESDITSINIAFFPVDPRLGTDFAQGARLFLENFNVRYFFPMHFEADWKAACSFEDYVTDNTTPVCLPAPGDSKELNL